jgi:hypothetical protein
MMTNRGTLNVARSLVRHPVLDGDPFDRRSAWLWLLSEAAWAPRGIVIDRRQVALRVGELVGSSRFLSKEWQWSEPKVRRFLQCLSHEGMIELRVVKDGPTDSGLTVVRVVNFEAWQTVRTRRTPDAPSDARSDAPTQAASHSDDSGLSDDENAPDAPSDTRGVSKSTQRHKQHKERK